jgi:hypothetical protein
MLLLVSIVFPPDVDAQDVNDGTYKLSWLTSGVRAQLWTVYVGEEKNVRITVVNDLGITVEKMDPRIGRVIPEFVFVGFTRKNESEWEFHYRIFIRPGQRPPFQNLLTWVFNGKIWANLMISQDILYWDTNNDGSVDIFDLVYVGSQFGKSITEQNIRANVNGDKRIDISDLVEVASRFGRKYPRPPRPPAAAPAAGLMEQITNPTARRWIEDFMRQQKRVTNPNKSAVLWGKLKKQEVDN